MDSQRLITHVNIRLNEQDMLALKEEAKKLRVPVSTYCRTQLTKHIEQL